MHRRRSTAIKLLSLAVLAFYVGPSVQAAPGDIVSAGPPAVGVQSGAPKPREKAELVSSSGEASYNVPFFVPPGRNGAQPSIGLYYGSRAPLRGGVAAGWTLPIPTISVDTSKGWLGGVHYQVDGEPLVTVSEPKAESGVDTYRLWHDGSYTRYEHHSDGSEQGYWIARTTDGSVLEYGKNPNARDQRSSAASGGTDLHTPPLYGNQGRWFLDQSVDRYGNEVTYSYQPVYGLFDGQSQQIDEALISIEYGRNTNVSGSFNHARIEFNYASSLETCFDSNVPIGAQFTYRGGIRRYEGARKLQSISAKVRANAGDSWQLRRRLDLAYDTSAAACGAPHAPLRVLNSLTLSTWAQDGTLTALPATTFDYGPVDYQFEDLGQDQHDNFGTGSQMHDPVNNGYPGSFSTTADVNGDGVLEHLDSGWDANGCTLSGDGYTIHIPGFPWANGKSPQTGAPYYTQETCNAAAQIVHRGGFGTCGEKVQINNFRLMDMNGDGLPDLVTQLSYKGDGYNPATDSAPVLAPIKGVSQYPACSALPTPMCTLPSGSSSGCLLDTPQLFSPNSAFSTNRMSTNNDSDTSSLPECPKSGSPDPSSCRQCPDTGSQCPNPNCKPGTYCNSCNDFYCSLESWPRATDDPSFGGDGGNGSAGFEFWGGIAPERQTSAAGPSGDHIRHMSNNEPCAIIPDMDCGSYVLRVYRNLGSGQFAKTPRMIYSPVPMSTQYYDGRADSGALSNAGSWSAFEDMDGDGYVDAVYQYPDQHSAFHDYGPGPLLVWRGNGTGNFYPAPDGKPYSWSVPATDIGGRMTINERDGYRTDVWSGYGANTGEQPGNNHTRSETKTTLQDINGDGLPDLLYSHGDWQHPEQLVYFNTGTGFDPHGIPLDATVGGNAPKIETTSRTITVPFVVDHSASGSTTDGYSVSTRRLLDMDGDGLPDVASMSAPKSGGPLPPDPYGNYQTSPIGDGQVWVHVNLGDRMAAVQLPSATAAYWYSSLLTITGYYGKSYLVNTDVVDEDGDGLPEVQQVTPQPGVCTEPYFDNCAASATEARVARLPYHRLTSIDNGFGAVTTFHYASVHDPDVVTITDPQFRAESPLWVVSQIDVTSPTTPDATATYRYTDPVTVADDFGRVNFHGFRETKSVSLAGQGEPTKTTVRRFDYGQDKLGHEVRRLVYDRDKLVSITDTSYVPLFTNDNSTKSFQVSEVRHFACTPTTGTGAEASCIRENNIARTTTTWSAFKLSSIYVPPGGGVPKPPPPPIGFSTMTLSTSTTGTLSGATIGGISIGGTSGGTTTTTDGTSTGTDPTLLYVPTTTQRSASTDGVHIGDREKQTKFVLYYASGQYLLRPFDHTTLEATAEGSFSGAKLLAHDATVYDLKAHGFPTKLRHEISPGDFAETVQVPDGYYNVASVARPNQVYSGSGLTRVMTYDAAGLYPVAVVNELGQRTEADWDIGLGKKTETRGPAQGSVMPYVQTDYDGLGRQIRQSRLHRFANGTLKNFAASYSVYHDTAALHDVEHSKRLDYSNTADSWLRDTFDAFGRVIREEASMSSYNEEVDQQYDGSGNVVKVTVNDPSLPYGEGTVDFESDYDGLGRPLHQHWPKRAPRTYEYGALTTRVYDTPNDDTIGLDKTTETDVFGRLVRVDEGSATHAITTYGYDAMDRMVHILDADGIPTDITYTLGGQRESIARIDPQNGSSQTLSYTYDHDGNRSSVTLPHTTTGGIYTSTWSYDALDRVRAFQPATMDFHSAEMRRYGLYSTLYFYDDTTRENGVGRLTSTYNYGLGTISYDYDLEGNVTSETRNLNVAPDGINMAANGTVHTTYNPLGTPQVVTYPDDPSHPTIARFAIDKRGRPQRMDLMVNGKWQVSMARFDRNRAGLVVKRTSGSPQLTEQQFQYDSAGRMKREDVFGSTTAFPNLIAGEIVSYGQDGNVRDLTDELTGRKLSYLYDDRSQLANVTASPNTTDYAADFTYTAAGSLDTARVQSSLPGAQVINRDVSYDYAGDDNDPPTDPAAPRNLIDQATGAVFSHMTYDASGNMTARAANSPLTMIYDGANHLREVINNSTGAHEIYFYDPNGQRILTYRPPDGSLPAKLIHRFGTTEITTSADGSRSTTADIVLGAHPVARVPNHDATAAKLLYHGVLGSLVAVADAANHGVRAQYGYGPYGEILYAKGPDAASYDHTYEDKARDAVSGLSYFGVRYYDPLSLGWTQADPMYRFVPDLAWDQPRRMNLYTYVLNNPLRYVDPDGRDGDTAAPAPAADRSYPPMDRCYFWGWVPDPANLNLGKDTKEYEDESQAAEAGKAALHGTMEGAEKFVESAATDWIGLAGLGWTAVELIAAPGSAQLAADNHLRTKGFREGYFWSMAGCIAFLNRHHSLDISDLRTWHRGASELVYLDRANRLVDYNYNSGERYADQRCLDVFDAHPQQTLDIANAVMRRGREVAHWRATSFSDEIDQAALGLLDLKLLEHP